MKKEEYARLREKALEYYKKANIVLTDEEKANVEVADFGLNMCEKVGLEIVTYVNTNKVCAKEMVLFPGQTCPEHRHVPSYGRDGKEETFRVRYGKVYLYGDGEPAENIHGTLPPTKTTVYHEVILTPGKQYTIMPGTLHWFQAGEDGAVVSEFSTTSTDETDYFTDEKIVRAPSVED